MGDYKYTFTLDPNKTSTDDEYETPISNPREDTLMKRDLYKPENLTTVKAFMGQKFGQDAANMTDEELVNGYVKAMRYFNTNLASTATEARRIMNADDDEKAVAGEAYKLYDRLGNVFVNDGVAGAFDGIADYMGAMVTDPSNYIGLITGGIGKATALGIGAAGKKAVQEAAKAAGKAAVEKGLSRTAQEAAVKKAVEATTRELAKRSVREPAKKKLIEQAAKRESDLFEYAIQRQAEQKYKEGLIKRGTKKSLLATAGLDATAAVVQDVMLQNTMIDVGAQEEYSGLQTAFSSLLGGVGAGVQLGAESLRGVSKLGGIEADVDIGKLRNQTQLEIDLTLSKEESKKAVDSVMKAATSWKDKVAAGKKAYEDVPTSSDFIREVMFGEDGKGGLVSIYKERGLRLPKNIRVTDMMTNLLQSLSEKELDTINGTIKGMGIKLGDTTHDATDLGNLIAYQASNMGKGMQVLSQVRKTLDSGIVHGQKILEEQTEEALEKVDKAQYGKYAQGLWRRMLVSSPATSAVNLFGFSQYLATTSIADILTMGGHYAAASVKSGAAREQSIRQAGVYKDMITQKLRYLADPYTTKEAYMKILEDHDGVRKTLYDSLTGGVDMSAERYGINKNNPFFRNIEAVAEGSAMIAGVRAQDTMTKSLMFISELDKHVRLKYDRTLEDVMRKGEMNLIDEEVIGNTMDATLKSVFSKDYTKSSNEVVAGAASVVETISRAPLIGTILPFGRFFNNVLATAHQMGPTGLVMEGFKVFKKDRSVTDAEALAKATVGTTFLGLAMAYDEERQKDELGMFQLKAGNTIINAQNTFPMSLFLAAGRLLNDKAKGRPANVESVTATLEQLAVGQLASDSEFGKGLTSMVVNLLEEDSNKSQILLDNFAKKGGNIAAGFTRPLDFYNKMIGMVANNDAAKDVRQERGFAVASVSATKYVDNILEAILGEIDGVSGQTLKVATREGEIRDPNPFLSGIGIKLVEGRTAGEQLYDKLDLPRYKANKRTEIAAYDRAYNEYIAPYLNDRAARRLADPSFRKLKKADQQAVWKNDLNDIASEIKDYMENNAPSSVQIDAIRRKASAVPSRSKKAALTYLKEEYGFDGSIRDMTYPELQAYFDYVDFYETEVNWND